MEKMKLFLAVLGLSAVILLAFSLYEDSKPKCERMVLIMETASDVKRFDTSGNKIEPGYLYANGVYFSPGKEFLLMNETKRFTAICEENLKLKNEQAKK